MNAQRKEQLRVKAQVNEYLYSLMKQEGIVARIDEDIGIDFMDFGIQTRSSTMIPNHVPTEESESEMLVANEVERYRQILLQDEQD